MNRTAQHIGSVEGFLDARHGDPPDPHPESWPADVVDDETKNEFVKAYYVVYERFLNLGRLFNSDDTESGIAANINR